MGRGAKWSCLLEKIVTVAERALRDARIVVLFTTLTKAVLAVNEPTAGVLRKANAEISVLQFPVRCFDKGRRASSN
jgi:hypothetical protein